MLYLNRSPQGLDQPGRRTLAISSLLGSLRNLALDAAHSSPDITIVVPLPSPMLRLPVNSMTQFSVRQGTLPETPFTRRLCAFQLFLVRIPHPLQPALPLRCADVQFM